MSMSVELTLEELGTEHAELLPAREALGGINWANIVASNTALALNAGSYASYASAYAAQKIVVIQH
jgi:hypothetical protein